MPVKQSEKTTYDIDQFRRLLDVPEWMLERAVRLGLVPAADVPASVTTYEGWSQELVDAAVADRERILAGCGDWPDYGAVRAAEILAERFGLVPGDLDANVVLELARTDVIPHVGWFKKYPVYCGRARELFQDREALDRARTEGQLFQRGGAAKQLGIRDSDFDHLLRAHWIEPASYAFSRHQSRRAGPSVPLFRQGDLQVLLQHPGIDWDAVRSTPRGRPSALANLTTKPRKADAR